jgi:hypothetical protein
VLCRTRPHSSRFVALRARRRQKAERLRKEARGVPWTTAWGWKLRVFGRISPNAGSRISVAVIHRRTALVRSCAALTGRRHPCVHFVELRSDI